MQHFTCYLRFVHKYYIYRKEIVHIAKIEKYQKNFDGKLAFFNHSKKYKKLLTEMTKYDII